ncbi:MAG: hypothetical protein NWR87_03780 [Rhodospirillales bacterium]|nr:hypothetical protein [Rhodospirillales bacterium]
MSRSTPRKKSSASIFPRASVVCATLLAVILSALPARAQAVDPYYQLIYDFEVAGFCGLIAHPVHDAFWSKRRRIEAGTERTPEQFTKTRILAMADAERAYIDRSLGGHKPWCRKDRVAGVMRIMEK